MPRDDLRRLRARLARLGAALARYETLQITLAALGVPLVVLGAHSIVGLDFAASLMPGWQETIFPPYFVVGAMYSGFAMVVVPRRCACAGAFGLQALITHRAFRGHGARSCWWPSIVMGLSYATEWFAAWYGGEHADRSLVVFEFTGAYAPLYWALLLCNVVIAAGVLVRRGAAQRRRASVRHRGR